VFGRGAPTSAVPRPPRDSGRRECRFVKRTSPTMASVKRVDSFMAWPRRDRIQRGKMLPRPKTAVQAGAPGDAYRFRAAGNAGAWPEAGRARPSAANPPRSRALSWLFAWRTGYASLRPGSYSCPFETMIARFEPTTSSRARKLFEFRYRPRGRLTGLKDALPRIAIEARIT
jgi:hypothetical protein